MATIQILIPDYLKYCSEQKRLDEKSLKAYRIDLTQLAETTEGTDVGDITQDMLETAISGWHRTLKPKTVKRKIASAKAFFRWTLDRNLTKENPFDRIHVKFREPKTLPRTIPDHTLETFLQSIYDEKRTASTEFQKRQALRDIAVFELLFATGIRISELCGITSSDIDLDEGFVLIHGKGKKERILQIPDGHLIDILSSYRNAFQNLIDTDGRFFRNGHGKPLTDGCVRRYIGYYSEKAGIKQHITPHMFRHTFATSLLDEDVNLRCIQELLGHSSVHTTEIYTHVSAAKQRDVLTNHHPRKKINVRTD